MTLIALHYNNVNGFRALSDSRASTKNNGRTSTFTDRFTKLFVIPYRFTSGPNGAFIFDLKGGIGFAFCGDILPATALYSICSNLLQNMHNSDGTSEYPTFELICTCIEDAAKLLHEDTLVTRARYEAYVFGFCPKTGEPGLAILGLSLVDGVYEIKLRPISVLSGMLLAMGSGAKYFNEMILPTLDQSEPFASMFLRAVRNNTDPGTGGPIQELIVTKDEAALFGVAQADKNYDTLDVYFSGVSVSEFKTRGGFHLGRIVRGAGNEVVTNRNALRELGYDPDDKAITLEIRNRAAFYVALKFAQREKAKAQVSFFASVDTPVPIKGKYYFSKVCGSCWHLSPVLADESSGECHAPFVGLGGFIAKCIFCGSSVSLPAMNAVSHIWK